MECPNCGSAKVSEEKVTESFDYLNIKNAFKATFLVLSCPGCQFSWRDFRSEDAIDTAMSQFANGEMGFTRADEQALLSEADYYEGKLRGDA